MSYKERKKEEKFYFIFIPLEESVSDEMANKSASSLEAKAKKGGIDLNPNGLDMQLEKKEGIGLQVPVVTPELIQQFRNTIGFSPVIINTAPILNLPLLLGLADDGEDTDMPSDFIDAARNKYFEEALQEVS